MVKEKEPVSRVYIDSTGWREGGRPSSQLNVLYNAILNSRIVDIAYSLPSYPVSEFIRTICPVGLVIKENVWYLVYLYQGKNWVIKAPRIISIKEREECFDYPGDFNLQAFWKEWCRDLSMQFDGYSVRVMVPEALKLTITLNIKESRTSIYSLPVDYKNTEWVEVQLFFDSFEEARGKLLALGGAVRVIEPIALKYSILDYAEQILALKD
jgi:predicted DNA-binding transcriptional regulator YafY